MTSRSTKSGRRKREKVEFTEAEWAIMKVVWEKEPCAAGTVQEALADTKGWAYATVKATMDRMVKKGLLRVQRIRNLQLFHSCIGEVEARKRELEKTLERAFGGTLTTMLKFLVRHEGLSREDLAELRDLVTKTQKTKER